jgi:hypothetical protein
LLFLLPLFLFRAGFAEEGRQRAVVQQRFILPVAGKFQRPREINE